MSRRPPAQPNSPPTNLRRRDGCRTGRVRALLAGVVATLAVAGCDASDGDRRPGGVTVGERRALDQAAEMLDDRRLSDAALPDAHEAGKDRPAASDR